VVFNFRPPGPSSDPVETVEVIVATLRTAGYRPIVAIPEPKRFTPTADAPTTDPGAEPCERAFERHVEAGLRRLPDTLSIDADLHRLEASGVATFLKADSPWNWRARELFARRLLDEIRPGLAKQVGLHAGPAFGQPPDLRELMRLHGHDPDRALETRGTPSLPLAPGSVVLLGDSQLDPAMSATPLPGVPPLSARVMGGQRICAWAEVVAETGDDAIRRDVSALPRMVRLHVGRQPGAGALDGSRVPLGH
jgi:hypothetical protein